MITAEGQRQQRASTRMQESIQRLRKAGQLRFAGIDEDIDEPVRGSPAWRHDEELTVSVPGVGPASSRTLIAEQPDLGTLDRRQVAALVGLAPFTRRSGKWRGKECIGGGRAIPRAVLFKGGDGRRPAQAAPQRLPRASAAGKPRMMALIAVARAQNKAGYKKAALATLSEAVTVAGTINDDVTLAALRRLDIAEAYGDLGEKDLRQKQIDKAHDLATGPNAGSTAQEVLDRIGRMGS